MIKLLRLWPGTMRTVTIMDQRIAGTASDRIVKTAVAVRRLSYRRDWIEDEFKPAHKCGTYCACGRKDR